MSSSPHWASFAALAVGLAATANASVPPAAPPVPEVAPAASRGGYFLSVELLGEASNRASAAKQLAADLDPRAPRDRLPPGEALGFFPRIELALLWIERHAFERGSGADSGKADARTLQHAPPPRIAAPIQRDHQVLVRAFIVTGATPEGDTRAIGWPADGSSILATEATWQGASLIPTRAPLFAAPAPTTPPTAESFATAERSGEVYVVGVHDSCVEPLPATRPRCLRWFRVVARTGDRFVPGYLPAYQVAVRDGWVRGQGTLPRAQLRPIGLDGGRALFLLLARGRDNVLHRTTIRVPAADSFPDLALTVDGDWGIVTVPGEESRRFPLDATLDARPPSPAPDSEPPPSDP